MKMRLINLSLAIVLLLTACQPIANLAGSLTSGGKASAFAYIFEANTNPINVTVALDGSKSVEAVIPIAGGTLSGKGKDGTTFTLNIPNDALLVDTSIRMTPVTNLTGLPFGSGDALAVQLEPEGLFFNNFVTLTITPAQEIPINQQILYTYQGSGKDVILAEPVVDSREIKIKLQHFSGYGVTKGLLADIEPVRQRIGGDAERRLASVAAERIGIERQKQLLGSSDNSDLVGMFTDLFKRYEEEVVKPRVAAAGESCAAGQLALQTVLGFERQKQLLGVSENGMDSVLKLMDIVGPVCVKEEYDLCKNDHVIHRMIGVWLGMERQSQLLGGGTGTEAIKLAKDLTQKCLTFDLVFTSEGTFDGGGGDGYTSSVTSTVKLKFNMDTLKFQADAPLVNKTFDYRMSDCKVTSNRGGGTFNLMDMGYTIQDNIPPGQVGKVTDFDLIYYPGNTSENFSVKCPDQAAFTAPAAPLWTGIFLITHQAEMDQAKGGFELKGWDVYGNEYYAKKEWITESAADGLVEAGSFKLYHRPG